MKRVFHEIMAFLILDEEAVEAPSFQNHWPDWGCTCLSMNVRRHIPVTMGWFPHFPHLVGCDLGIVWYSIAMNWTSKRWEFWKMENPHPFVALALPLGASIVTKGQKTSPKCWKFILLMVRTFGANNSSLLYSFLPFFYSDVLKWSMMTPAEKNTRDSLAVHWCWGPCR